MSIDKLMEAALVNGTTLRFANIPQGYTGLRVYVQGQSQRAGYTNTGLRIRWNGIATASYYTFYSSRAFADAANAITSNRTAADTFGYLGQTPAGSRTNDQQASQHVVEFPFYSQSGNQKWYVSSGGWHDAASGSGWTDAKGFTAAIDPILQIDIIDDVGSLLGPLARATLYGF